MLHQEACLADVTGDCWPARAARPIEEYSFENQQRKQYNAAHTRPGGGAWSCHTTISPHPKGRQNGKPSHYYDNNSQHKKNLAHYCCRNIAGDYGPLLRNTGMNPGCPLTTACFYVAKTTERTPALHLPKKERSSTTIHVYTHHTVVSMPLKATCRTRAKRGTFLKTDDHKVDIRGPL